MTISLNHVDEDEETLSPTIVITKASLDHGGTYYKPQQGRISFKVMTQPHMFKNPKTGKFTVMKAEADLTE